MRKISGKSIKNDIFAVLPFPAAFLVFCICSPNVKNTPQTDSKVLYDSPAYTGSSATATITLVEPDHKATGAVVKISSQSDPAGIIVPLSTIGPTDTLKGTFGFTVNSSVPGEKIKVANGDIITATYFDTGEGTSSCQAGWSAAIADFKLTNEIQGWTSSSYTEFVPSTLHTVVNGMDDMYAHDSTLVKGFSQYLDDSVTKTSIEARVMDFGTPANATAMYHKIKPITVPDDKYNTNPFNIPPYDTSTAIARPVTGGITAYAHFDKYYFELSNSGYAVQDSALADIKLFLGKYQSIAQ